MSTSGRNRVVSGRVRVSLSNFGSGSCRVLVSGQTFPTLFCMWASKRYLQVEVTSIMELTKDNMLRVHVKDSISDLILQTSVTCTLVLSFLFILLVKITIGGPR